MVNSLAANGKGLCDGGFYTQRIFKTAIAKPMLSVVDSVGKVVEITFSINGRRNTGKDNVERIFNTLTGFQLKNL